MPPFDEERLRRAMGNAGTGIVPASSRHNGRYLTGGYYRPLDARAPRFGRGRYLSLVGVPPEPAAAPSYVAYSAAPNTRDALIPPNPNELLSA